MKVSIEAEMELGGQEIQNGELDQARARFQALLDSDLKEACVYDGLARTAFAAGDLETAIGNSEKALGLEPENPDFINMLGVARYNHGDHFNALQLMVQACGQHPEHKLVHANSAEMLSANGNRELAFSILEQYVGATGRVDDLLEKAGALIDAELAGQRVLMS